MDVFVYAGMEYKTVDFQPAWRRRKDILQWYQSQSWWNTASGEDLLSGLYLRNRPTSPSWKSSTWSGRPPCATISSRIVTPLLQQVRVKLVVAQHPSQFCRREWGCTFLFKNQSLHVHRFVARLLHLAMDDISNVRQKCVKWLQSVVLACDDPLTVDNQMLRDVVNAPMKDDGKTFRVITMEFDARTAQFAYIRHDLRNYLNIFTFEWWLYMVHKRLISNLASLSLSPTATWATETAWKTACSTATSVEAKALTADCCSYWETTIKKATKRKREIRAVCKHHVQTWPRIP